MRKSTALRGDGYLFRLFLALLILARTICTAAALGVPERNSFPIRPQQSWASQQEGHDAPVDSFIVPGKSVGLLHLKDTRNSVLRFFNLKEGIDQEYEYTWCAPRSEIHWLDKDELRPKGDIRFFLREGRVFQIESATPRFHTREGITVDSSPQSVRRHYVGLKAYVLVNSGGDIVGGKDLIYWVSRSKGIAFEFSYDRATHRRLVYHVIIFEPGSQFFPQGCIVPPQEWRALPRYSLESRTDPEREVRRRH